MRLVVTGAGGQLGQDIARMLGKAHDIHAYDKRQLDVTDPYQVRAMMKKIRPDAIIHAAAYTKVDAAESDPDAAYVVNALGARNVAAAASRIGAAILYVSTDYVFDGSKQAPYDEFDTAHPLSVYGSSKLWGEWYVQTLADRFYIVRTSWLYSRSQNNFVAKIAAAARSGATLRVVEDEIGSPTYTKDLAVFLEELVESDLYGIYHASNAGHCTRYEFARTILNLSGFADVAIEPIQAADLQLPAPRPRYSALDHRMIRLNRLREMPGWQDALERCLKGVHLNNG